MPFGMPKGAMCVQRFDDSLNSAIHTTYRISLRSSSLREPRDPLLKVVSNVFVFRRGGGPPPPPTHPQTLSTPHRPGGFFGAEGAGRARCSHRHAGASAVAITRRGKRE